MTSLRATDRCASRRLLLVTCTLAFLACREDSASTVEQVRIDLVDQLPVAEAAGKVERLDGDSPSAFRLYADSNVTYHFAVPAGARLVGEVIGSGDSLAQVLVETTDESGDRHSLLDAAIEDASWPLHADLSAYAGQMLRLRFSVNGKKAFKEKVEPSLEALLSSWIETEDPALLYDVTVEIDLDK